MRSTVFTALFALVASSVVLAAPLPDGGSAYTGAGGQAVGGSKYTTSGFSDDGSDLLNIGGGGAGDGGKATSGTAVGGYGYNGHGGNAYSGAGGNTNGGNVVENHPRGLLGGGSYGWGAHRGGLLGGSDVLNVAEGNAGNGGDSSTGNAYGGDSFHQ